MTNSSLISSIFVSVTMPYGMVSSMSRDVLRPTPDDLSCVYLMGVDSVLLYQDYACHPGQLVDVSLLEVGTHNQDACLYSETGNRSQCVPRFYYKIETRSYNHPVCMNLIRYHITHSHIMLRIKHHTSYCAARGRMWRHETSPPPYKTPPPPPIAK